jgi:hypothetical protein
MTFLLTKALRSVPPPAEPTTKTPSSPGARGRVLREPALRVATGVQDAPALPGQKPGAVPVRPQGPQPAPRRAVAWWEEAWGKARAEWAAVRARHEQIATDLGKTGTQEGIRPGVVPAVESEGRLDVVGVRTVRTLQGYYHEALNPGAELARHNGLVARAVVAGHEGFPTPRLLGTFGRVTPVVPRERVPAGFVGRPEVYYPNAPLYR